MRMPAKGLVMDGSLRRLPPNPARELLVPVELGAAAGDLLGGKAVDIGEVELPGRVVAPAQRRLHRRARARRGFEDAQRELQREGLGFGVVRLPGRVAERKVAEQEARDADIFDDILGTAHDDRRDAILFEVTGGQTHGLVTYRS